MRILDRLTDKVASRIDKRDFIEKLKEKYRFKITPLTNIDGEAELSWQRIKKSHLAGAFETAGITKSDICVVLAGLKKEAIENNDGRNSPAEHLNRADRRKLKRSNKKGDANRRR